MSAGCFAGQYETHTHLFGSDGSLAGFPKFFYNAGITPEILLASDENDG